MARISITINPQLKIDLEHMAKANFRTLNGEINKALDWYVRSNLGEVIEPQRETLSTSTHIIEPLSHIQTQIPVTSINMNDNIYDEIEEF